MRAHIQHTYIYTPYPARPHTDLQEPHILRDTHSTRGARGARAAETLSCVRVGRDCRLGHGEGFSKPDQFPTYDTQRPTTSTTLYSVLGCHVVPAINLAASVPANRPLLVNVVLGACVFTRSRGRPLAASDGAAFAGRCFLAGGASSRAFSTGLPLASSIHSTGCAALALPFFLCDRDVPKSTCSPHRASKFSMNASSASGRYALECTSLCQGEVSERHGRAPGRVRSRTLARCSVC